MTGKMHQTGDPIKMAVVPAAGKGTRLGRVGAAIPKALVPIDGRPAIDHIFEMLRNAGIERVILIVGYKKEQLISYIEDGSDFGLKVAYITQPLQHGIAEAISLAEPFVHENFLCILGDTILDPADSLKQLAEFHVANKPSVTLMVTPMQNTVGYGVIEAEGNHVKRVVEKPSKGESPSNLAIVGCYAFSPKIFDATKQTQQSNKTGEVELTDAIEKLIDWGEKISFVTFHGTYIDTGKLAPGQNASGR